LDGDGYSHSLCTHGYLAGVNFYGCDPSYEYKGSYGIGAEFNVRVSRTSQISEPIRQEARAAAILQFLNKFNRAPVGIRPGFYLQSQDAGVSFFDGKMQEALPYPVPKGGLIMTTGDQLGIFDPEGDKVTVYTPGSDGLSPNGPIPKAFIDSPLEQRLKFRDMLLINGGVCILHEDNLVCMKNKFVQEIKLTSIRGQSLLALGQNVAITDASGYTYLVPKVKANAKLDESVLKKSKKPLDLFHLVPTPKKRFYGLGLDGVIREYKTVGGTGTTVQPLKDQRFTRMYGPIWWSSQLKDL
jgi:hypothetical protein